MQWYKKDVQQAVLKRELCGYAPKTVFYGSSSINLWESLYDDFAAYLPVNLGFGGSTLLACAWFFDEIVAPVKSAERIIFYAGDNDLGDGKHPKEVCKYYREFILKLRHHFPALPCYFISIKPSIERFENIEEIKETNTLIAAEINSAGSNESFINIFDKMLDASGKPVASYFSEDGLHMSKAGYAVWKEAIFAACFGEQFQYDQNLS